MNSPKEKTLEISTINSKANSVVFNGKEIYRIFSLLEQSIIQKCNHRVKGNKMFIKIFKNDSIHFNNKVKPVNKMKQKLQTLLSNKTGINLIL